MENIVLTYFRGLFASSNPENVERVTHVISSVITDTMNVELITEIDAEKVWQVVKQMHPSKAPGPDIWFLSLFLSAFLEHCRQ